MRKHVAAILAVLVLLATVLVATPAMALSPPPVVTTGAASGITQTAAVLNGTANPQGAATTCHFDWGLTTGYGSVTADDTSPGSGAVSFVGAGPDATGTASGLSVGLPSGLNAAKNDVLYLDVSARSPNTTIPTLNAISGWTQFTVGDQANTQSLRAATYVRKYQAGDTSPTITGSSIDSLAAKITAYRNSAAATNVATYHDPLFSGGTLPLQQGPLTVAASTSWLHGMTATRENEGVTQDATMLERGEVHQALRAVVSASDSNAQVPTGTTTKTATLNDPTTTKASTLSEVLQDPATVAVSAPLSGLAAGTTYHFRLSCANEGGTSLGADQSFTTLAQPAPTVTTDLATGVTVNAATLNGTVNPNGASTSYHFEYGLTTGYGTNAPVPDGDAGSGTTSVGESAAIGSLAASTTYHFRLVATNSGGTTNGTDQSFTTLAPQAAPTVTTDPATGVTASTATLNGTVNPNGASTSYRFEYGLTTGYGTNIPVPDGNAGSGTTPVGESAAIGSLTASTTYHFRLVATNSGGATNGADQSFTTAASGPTLHWDRDTILPGWQNYAQVHVGGLSTTVNVTQNTRVICDTPLQKRLIIQGSANANVAVIGCEINITDPALSDIDHNIVHVQRPDAATGTLWFEGVWGHGAVDVPDDGFTGSAASMDWYVQASLISIYGSSANHSDCIQPWSGHNSFQLDMFTCYSNFQGFMFKADWNEWKGTTIDRVNLRHQPNIVADGYLVNLVCGSSFPDRCGSNNTGDPYITGPLHFGSNFYIIPKGGTPLNNDPLHVDMRFDVAPAAQFTFTTDPVTGLETATPISPFKGVVMDGVIKEGTPPGGDYEPAGGGVGQPGQGYSPP